MMYALFTRQAHGFVQKATYVSEVCKPCGKLPCCCGKPPMVKPCSKSDLAILLLSKAQLCPRIRKKLVAVVPSEVGPKALGLAQHVKSKWVEIFRGKAIEPSPTRRISESGGWRLGLRRIREVPQLGALKTVSLLGEGSPTKI